MYLPFLETREELLSVSWILSDFCNSLGEKITKETGKNEIQDFITHVTSSIFSHTRRYMESEAAVIAYLY